MLRRFLGDRRGTLMPLFALSVIPIVGFAGAAIDTASYETARSRLQTAVDATALAANRDSSTRNFASASAFFASQDTGLQQAALDPDAFDTSNGQLTLRATAHFTPKVMSAFGLAKDIILSAQATSVLGQENIEVAMVLDNSGSMGGSKIASLIEAANSLTDSLFQVASENTSVNVGVVPFSGAVNVGPANATASWMDTQGLSPIHFENFNQAANRFTLFSQMRDTSWAGCVETRPYPLDVNDAAPDVDDPKTLFVPMFAPDEPDDDTHYDDFANDYLDDRGGTCGSNPSGDAQGRTCKYNGATPSTRSSGATNKGPNFWCNSRPIVPLTSTKSTITTAINGMVAKGYTNIHEGLMWGWRVLSPGAPFTGGAAYTDPKTRKYIVLMTDGENTINGTGSYSKNHSDYSAYGYAIKDRLGTTSGSSSTLEDAMDDRLEEACTNAKAAGITIYTVAFQVRSQSTKDMLVSCATSSSMAYQPSSTSDLVPVFQAIAQQLGALRISQ